MGRTIYSACKLNAQGLYGNQEAAADRTNDVYIIDYFYQVSVVQGTSTTQLRNAIEPELDIAITTAILPRFFNCDVNGRKLNESRDRWLQDGGVVEAISSLPQDILVLSGCK
jgi:hypothetical protein